MIARFVGAVLMLLSLPGRMPQCASGKLSRRNWMYPRRGGSSCSQIELAEKHAGKLTIRYRLEQPD